MTRRRAEPRIVDPATHPRSEVGLTVAADFLKMSPRAVRARIEDGRLPAWHDEKVYAIAVTDLVTYRDRCQKCST